MWLLCQNGCQDLNVVMVWKPWTSKARYSQNGQILSNSWQYVIFQCLSHISGWILLWLNSSILNTRYINIFNQLTHWIPVYARTVVHRSAYTVASDTIPCIKRPSSTSSFADLMILHDKLMTVDISQSTKLREALFCSVLQYVIAFDRWKLTFVPTPYHRFNIYVNQFECLCIAVLISKLSAKVTT